MLTTSCVTGQDDRDIARKARADADNAAWMDEIRKGKADPFSRPRPHVSELMEGKYYKAKAKHRANRGDVGYK